MTIGVCVFNALTSVAYETEKRFANKSLLRAWLKGFAIFFAVLFNPIGFFLLAASETISIILIVGVVAWLPFGLLINHFRYKIKLKRKKEELMQKR